MVQPILPGDSLKVSSEIFMRLAPMLAPIMHRVNVYTHYFFVPNRIVWNDWESFITGGKDGTESPVPPNFAYNDSNKQRFEKGKLCDYMGIPTVDQAETLVTDERISSLPFRAYTQIYNDYFRDQNLEDEIDFSKASGTEATADAITTLRQRAWPKDYFSSCLPWSQRGPEVAMSVKYKDQSEVFTSDGNIPSNIDPLVSRDQGDFGGLSSEVSNELLRIENIEGITINELRRSVRLQEWLEKNARGGARYVEQLLSHWGVLSDDARLQRAEWLGGGKSPVAISEVLQTGATGTDTSIISTPQGNMAGHGISASGMNGFRKRFKEHGYVIGIMSVLPIASYQQGIQRHFQRFDKLDYPWPEFANLGEQEVLNREIYFDPTDTDTNNRATFGYQSRYAEEKFGLNSVHGDFRDNLNYWHMGRIFDSRPNLNEDFIKSDPTKRIFAVESPDEDELYCQIYNKVSALRKLPYFGTPRL